MFDPALRIRIILGPQPHKLVQMVGTCNQKMLTDLHKFQHYHEFQLTKIFAKSMRMLEKPELPYRPMCGRIAHKGPSGEPSGRTNHRPNQERILPERAEKGPDFETAPCLYFSRRNDFLTNLVFKNFTLKLFKYWSNFERNYRVR